MSTFSTRTRILHPSHNPHYQFLIDSLEILLNITIKPGEVISPGQVKAVLGNAVRSEYEPVGRSIAKGKMLN